jgi:hypothetical protein
LPPITDECRKFHGTKMAQNGTKTRSTFPAAFPLAFGALRAFGMGSRFDAVSHRKARSPGLAGVCASQICNATGRQYRVSAQNWKICDNGGEQTPPISPEFLCPFVPILCPGIFCTPTLSASDFPYPSGGSRLALRLDLIESDRLCEGGRIGSVHKCDNGHKFEGPAAA